jgi:hypothetical protein
LGDFKDGTNTGTDDYSYDANGNLTLDNNKAISSITYNHLNLPSIITVTGILVVQSFKMIRSNLLLMKKEEYVRVQQDLIMIICSKIIWVM